jgi:uncharacterized protein
MKNKKKTLLWKIEGEDLPGPSYVFGTMHVRDRRAFQNREQIYTRIDACDAFAIEFHLEEIAAGIDPQFLSLPDGATLDRLIPARKYDKIRRIFQKSAGLDIHPLRRMKPILLTNLIDNRIFSDDMALALDEHLWQYAGRQGKLRLGVETYEEQLAILANIPIQTQIDGLLWMAGNLGRHRKALLRMAELYESGDPVRIFKAAKRGAREFRKLLLYNRNAIMAERIAEMARQQTTFFAIGAGHLGGKKGVLRLLKREGGLWVRPGGDGLMG